MLFNIWKKKNGNILERGMFEEYFEGIYLVIGLIVKIIL